MRILNDGCDPQHNVRAYETFLASFNQIAIDQNENVFAMHNSLAYPCKRARAHTHSAGMCSHPSFKLIKSSLNTIIVHSFKNFKLCVNIYRVIFFAGREENGSDEAAPTTEEEEAEKMGKIKIKVGVSRCNSNSFIILQFYFRVRSFIARLVL